MKLESKHIEEIKLRFSAMATIEEFVELLNYAKPLLYGKKTFPFALKQITYFANPKVSGERYRDFKIKKKTGGERTIHAPRKGLKAIQRCLNVVLQCVFEPHKAVTGFVLNKSIVDNAKTHAGNFYIYNIDLENFFPSVDQARVWKCLQLPPFNLNAKHTNKPDLLHVLKKGYQFHKTSHAEFLHFVITDKGILRLLDKGDIDRISERLKPLADEYGVESKDLVTQALAEFLKDKANKKIESADRTRLAGLIANLCCTEMEVERWIDGQVQKVRRNVLPQGAPTSPLLTNVICQRLDFLLSGVAKRFGCKYTRYADDITFSSLHNVYQSDGEFIKELNRIISEQGFRIKAAKTRLQKSGYRQEVTGLIVNEKANIKRRYVKELRKWLHMWEQYGYEKAYSFFLDDYLNDRGYAKSPIPNMKFVIKGKLDFLGMVKGSNNTAYKSLMERYKNLSELRKETSLEEVLDVLIDEGLDKAMDLYSRT